jgi:hypothetical protein
MVTNRGLLAEARAPEAADASLATETKRTMSYGWKNE